MAGQMSRPFRFLSMLTTVTHAAGFAFSASALYLHELITPLAGGILVALVILRTTQRVCDERVRAGVVPEWHLVILPLLVTPIWYYVVNPEAALWYGLIALCYSVRWWNWGQSNSFFFWPVARAWLSSLRFGLLAPLAAAIAPHASVTSSMLWGMALMWGGASSAFELLHYYQDETARKGVSPTKLHGPIPTAMMAMASYIVAGYGAYLIDVLHVVIAAQIMTSYAALAMPLTLSRPSFAVPACASLSFLLHAWAPALQYLLS